MVPILAQIERPGTPTIGKTKGSHLPIGTWFLGRLEMRGEGKLYHRVFDVVVDVADPINTFAVDEAFYDVREVGVKLDFWKL